MLTWRGDGGAGAADIDGFEKFTSRYSKNIKIMQTAVKTLKDEKGLTGICSFLRGKVASVLPDRMTVDVGGVGFQILVSIRGAADMPPAGSEVKIHTYMSVSEDAIRLYGFLSQDDLNVYRSLISVSGGRAEGGAWNPRDIERE